MHGVFLALILRTGRRLNRGDCFPSDGFQNFLLDGWAILLPIVRNVFPQVGLEGRYHTHILITDALEITWIVPARSLERQGHHRTHGLEFT